MNIHGRHERSFKGEADAVKRILDGLSGPEDRLWPRDVCPDQADPHFVLSG